MPDDNGDLRDRFRRTDYRSTPFRPRPARPSGVTGAGSVRPAPMRAENDAITWPDQPPKQPTGPEPPLPVPDKISIASTAPEPETRPRPPQARPIVAAPERKIFTDEAEPEPAIPSLEAFNPPPKAKSNRSKRRAARKAARTTTKARKWLVIAPLILFVLSGGGLVAWHYLGKKVEVSIIIPSQYTSASLGFQLYYPKNLPYGYRVGPRSFSYENGALVFYIDTGDGKTIPVSEQAVPDGKTAAELVPAPTGVKVADVQAIAFDGGTSALSKWNSRTLTSTVVGKTWIILNVTDLSSDAAKTLTQAFTKL